MRDSPGCAFVALIVAAAMMIFLFTVIDTGELSVDRNWFTNPDSGPVLPAAGAGDQSPADRWPQLPPAWPTDIPTATPAAVTGGQPGLAVENLQAWAIALQEREAQLKANQDRLDSAIQEYQNALLEQGEEQVALNVARQELQDWQARLSQEAAELAHARSELDKAIQQFQAEQQELANEKAAVAKLKAQVEVQWLVLYACLGILVVLIAVAVIFLAVARRSYRDARSKPRG